MKCPTAIIWLWSFFFLTGGALLGVIAFTFTLGSVNAPPSWHDIDMTATMFQVCLLGAAMLLAVVMAGYAILHPPDDVESEDEE